MHDDHSGAAPLMLELAIDAHHPLEGHVSSQGGTTRAFAGWAGLASALTTFLEEWQPSDDRGAAQRGL